MANILLIGENLVRPSICGIVYKELDAFRPHIVTVGETPFEMGKYAKPILQKGFDGGTAAYFVEEWGNRRSKMTFVQYSTSAAAAYALEHSIPCFPVDMPVRRKTDVPFVIPRSFGKYNETYYRAMAGLYTVFEGLWDVLIIGDYLRKLHLERHLTSEGMRKRTEHMGGLINVLAIIFRDKYPSLRLAHVGLLGHFRRDKSENASIEDKIERLGNKIAKKLFVPVAGGYRCIEEAL